MEEKLLEIMEKNEKSLNKSKEELNKIMEEEANRHRMVVDDGKFVKTSEQKEYEEDLTKIEQELDNLVKDRKILDEKKKKEHEIAENNKKIKSLNINKKECEEAIKEEQGKKNLVDGKFVKTPYLIEYEKDLEKINTELNSALVEKKKHEQELETLNSYVNKMISKYNVKTIMEKEEKSETEQDIEQEKIEEDVVDIDKDANIEEIETEKADQKKEYIICKDTEILDKDGKIILSNDPKETTTARASQKTKKTNPKTEKYNTIKYIEIVEKDGKIIYDIKEDDKEYNISIKQISQEKKEKFKRLGISEMCKEVAGGKIKGMLLKRKINPEIVTVLENNPIQLKEYVSCINENKELPFELVHNLIGTNIFEKLKLNRFVRAEEKSGARVFGQLFDKNRTLVAKEKTKAIASKAKETVKDYSKEKYENVKSKGRDFIEKIPNKDSRLETKAVENLRMKEKELAENVKKIMEEENEKQ